MYQVKIFDDNVSTHGSFERGKRGDVIYIKLGDHYGDFNNLIDFFLNDEIRSTLEEKFKKSVNFSNISKLINISSEIDRLLDGQYLLIILKNDKSKFLLRDILGFISTYVMDYNNETIISDQRINRIEDKLLFGFRVHPFYVLQLSKGNKKSTFKLYYNFHDIFYSGIRAGKVDIDLLTSFIVKYYYYRLEKIIRRNPKRKIYVSYSGGVDSSIVLKMLSDLGLDVVAITIQEEGRVPRVVKKFVKDNRADIVYIEGYTEDEVLEDLKKVVSIIEDYTPMNVSLALAQYWVFREVPSGHILALGQGADELYGGYEKFIRTIYQRL